jgi:hypothetical protein
VPVITADVDRRAATLTVHAQLATYLAGVAMSVAVTYADEPPLSRRG